MSRSLLPKRRQPLVGRRRRRTPQACFFRGQLPPGHFGAHNGWDCEGAYDGVGCDGAYDGGDCFGAHDGWGCDGAHDDGAYGGAHDGAGYNGAYPLLLRICAAAAAARVRPVSSDDDLLRANASLAAFA